MPGWARMPRDPSRGQCSRETLPGLPNPPVQLWPALWEMRGGSQESPKEEYRAQQQLQWEAGKKCPGSRLS